MRSVRTEEVAVRGRITTACRDTHSRCISVRPDSICRLGEGGGHLISACTISLIRHSEGSEEGHHKQHKNTTEIIGTSTMKFVRAVGGAR